MAFSFPFFRRTEKSGKPIIKEVSKPAVAKDNSVTEAAKPTVNIPKGFNKNIGEEHPFDFNLVEDICKNVPIVSGAVNKTVDMCISDFQIKSDNPQIQTLCDDFVEQHNFDMYLRSTANNIVRFANAFTEIVDNGNAEKLIPATKITELKPLNPKYLYVRRDEYGKILEYNQCINLGAKKISFTPTEMAHYKYNVVGDSAYGYSMVAPLINIIQNKLNMERSMMILMDRKANAPVHVKLGTPEDPATSDDVQQFANDLYNLNNRTEWVTDHRVAIDTIDFAGKIMNFAPFNEHFENQLVYGLEVPIVLLGRGNIPEGLAAVQLEAFARRLASIRLLIENVNEQSIFQPLIKMAGLKGKVQFDWEPQSEDDKWKEVEKITALMGSVSDPIRVQLEDRIAKILGITIAVQNSNNPFSVKSPQQNPFAKTNPFQPQQTPQNPFTKPNPFQVQNATDEPLIGGPDMTIEEWTMRSPFPLLDRIRDFLARHKFGDVDISKDEKEKLRTTLMHGMSKNLMLSSLRDAIAKSIGVDKTRAEKIARTETVRATSEALLDDFADKGIDKARWVVIGDNRLCETCAPMQSKVFTIEAAKGLIPKHTNCRCTWSAVLGETFTAVGETPSGIINKDMHEHKSQPENSVKEVKNKIILNGRGAGKWVTTDIIGTLKSVTVVPEKNQNVLLRITTAEDVQVLFESNITKPKTFVPMIQPSTDGGEYFSQNCTEIVLNGPLNLEVQGGLNKEVEVKIRWV
jgi:SPP1 gp7 family putative phage head morphogenesis protein